MVSFPQLPAPVEKNDEIDNAAQGKLSVRVSPNPSYGPFNIMVESDKSEAYSVRVFDILGREMERRINLQPNARFNIGG
jgi:hypothetical protein